jgi:hypothetical protein
MIVVGIKYWQAVTLGTVLNGPAIMAPYNGRMSAAFTWTGTPTGTFALQCRMAGGTWDEVPGAAAEFTTSPNAQPAGGASTTPTTVNFSVVPGTEYRFVYTGSGAGTVTCNIAQGDVMTED